MTLPRRVLTSAGIGVLGAVLSAEVLVRCGAPSVGPAAPTAPAAPATPVAPAPSVGPAPGSGDAGDAARTLGAIDAAVTELERAVDGGAQEDGRDDAG